MIDQDETFAFSRICHVNFDQARIFSVYPNPVRDQLTVESDNTATVGKVQIYNASGGNLHDPSSGYAG